MHIAFGLLEIVIGILVCVFFQNIILLSIGGLLILFGIFALFKKLPGGKSLY